MFSVYISIIYYTKKGLHTPKLIRSSGAKCLHAYWSSNSFRSQMTHQGALQGPSCWCFTIRQHLPSCLSWFPPPVVFILTAAAHTYHMTACCDTSWVWTQPIRSNRVNKVEYHITGVFCKKTPPHSICNNQLLLSASAPRETNRLGPKWSDITHQFLLEVDEGAGYNLSDEDQQEAGKVLRGDDKQHIR